MAGDDFHKQLLDNLNSALLLVQPDPRVSFINASAQALLALSESRIIGFCIDQLFPQQQEMLAELQVALRDHSAYTNRGVCVKLASGKEITIDLVVTPFQAESGENSGLILELQPVDRIMRISSRILGG